MLLNRAAAVGQALTTAIALATAITPIDVGFVRGPVTIALGGAYIATCVAAFALPSRVRVEAATAATGVVWWALRAESLLLADRHPRPYTGAATCALVALMVFLFYWRSLARAGFLDHLDRMGAEARG